MQLGQTRPDELLSQVGSRVAVVVYPGHSVHGVVAEGAQIIGASVSIIVVVVMVPPPRVEAALVQHCVAAVLQADVAALRTATARLP